MSDDYINRVAFKRKLIDEKAVYPACVDRALDEMPAEAVVKVVRCKDCKHRETSECSMVFYETVQWDDDGYLETERITHDNTEDDGFCSCGERKDNG